MKPLSDRARSILAEIAKSPIPGQEVDADVASYLLDEDLVAPVQLPSPYRMRPGLVPHLQITVSGRAAIEPKRHVVTVQIDNCLDCRHSKAIRDPSSGDSFDAFDESLCCTKTPNCSALKETSRGELIPGRVIVACVRGVSRKDAAVPEWCPLLDKKGVE